MRLVVDQPTACCMSFKYIRLHSDLHLEQCLGSDPSDLCDQLIPVDVTDADSLLVLAGDISSKMDQLVLFLEFAAKRFEHVLYVAGNHEFYGNELHSWYKKLHARKPSIPNVTLASPGMSSVELGGVRFIHGTLWGDGGPTLQDRAKTGQGLRDFYVIKLAEGNSYRRFTVMDMIEEHANQKRQLRELLEWPFDGPTVVVTHHLPSRRLISPRFWPSDGSDGINGGFAGDCDNIIAGDLAPKLWLHGHTHDLIDTHLWKTRVLCNPSGYFYEKRGNDPIGGDIVLVPVEELYG